MTLIRNASCYLLWAVLQLGRFFYEFRKWILNHNEICTVMCTKNFTSGSILVKKSYGRFQFQVKNSLHWTVQCVTNKVNRANICFI
jgi:hypothetical protein